MTSSTIEQFPVRPAEPALVVTLHNGESLDLRPFDFAQLQRLQWDQERGFAALLAASQQGSARRAELFRHAYDTVCTIHGHILSLIGSGCVMGYDPRYAALVRRLLERRTEKQRRARVFEIGFGRGDLLASLAGVQISGIEVSAAMREQALERLPAECHGRLYLGDLLSLDVSAAAGCDVVFWNDVFEHLVPDDVPAFLRRIHELLAPGGYLVTITPNWHARPWDITRDFCPPRTTAQGFHLKEYTLGEVSGLVRAAGFRSVATPLVVTRGRIVLAGSGLLGCKSLCESLLEYLPFRCARLACRALGLSVTIARK